MKSIKQPSRSGLSYAVGATLLLIGLVLVAQGGSSFQVGVGLALGTCGFAAVRAGAFLRSQGTPAPSVAIESTRRGLREWWRTPKLYPNGSSFTPKQRAGYYCVALVAIAVMVVMFGWSMQALSDGLSRAWHASQGHQ